MTGNIKVNWKRLILAMVISIGAGVISWLLTGNSMEIYRDLNKPALSPPGQLFPIVWTILYILMGISYGILASNSLVDSKINSIYYLQLFFNALWPIAFFLLKVRIRRETKA